jgi:molybdopterin molybdotransferase
MVTRTVEEHLSKVLADAHPLTSLDVTLVDANGCVLAADVSAPWPVPPFDTSSADGFAIQVADVAAASPQRPVTLSVIDDVPAGYRATESVRAGTAIRLSAGALLPEGAEAVVPRESCVVSAMSIAVSAPVAQLAQVRRRGEDVELGTVVLRAGEVLGPRQLSLLAAVGAGRAPVHPKPRAVVMSVGTELVAEGTPLLPGLVPDAVGVMIASAAIDCGADAFRVGPIPDHQRVLLSTLEDQLVRADIVVMVGGVSDTARVAVESVLTQLGTIESVNVAMVPGSRHVHGHVGVEETPVFALPSSPMGAYVAFEVFVRPVLRRMSGHQDIYRTVVRAVAGAGLRSPHGVRSFVRANLIVEGGRYVVHPVLDDAEHHIASLANTDALIVVPDDITEVRPGDAVVVMRLDEK